VLLVVVVEGVVVEGVVVEGVVEERAVVVRVVVERVVVERVVVVGVVVVVPLRVCVVLLLLIAVHRRQGRRLSCLCIPLSSTHHQRSQPDR